MKVIKEAGLAVPESIYNGQTAIARFLPRRINLEVSSPLISESPDASNSAAISPWQVTTLSLPAPVEVEFLSTCVSIELLAPGIIIGKDYAFWTVAMRFAASLTARQRFLPGLTEIQGNYYACWEPLLSGTDGHTLAKLAAWMPLVCRALTLDDPSPPVRPASQVLADFLGRMVDQLVRFSTPTTPEPASIRRGRPARKTSEFDSLHDQWLHALNAPDGQMAGDPSDLAQLHEHIQQWQRPVTVTAAAPFHLCFRLEEPQDTTLSRSGEERRFLCYLLQAADDPSLLIPVREAWNPQKPMATLLRPGEFHAKDYLLVSLGQSARLFPELEAGLQEGLPDGQPLDTQSAFAFLTEKAMVMEQAGFAVMLPAWWSGRASKMRLSARGQVKSPKMAGGSGLNLARLCNSTGSWPWGAKSFLWPNSRNWRSSNLPWSRSGANGYS